MPASATQATVATVRADVPVAALGRTLMHEHVFVLSTEVAQNYPDTWGDEEERVATAARQLDELKVAGVDTIVDMTVIGLGRNIPRIQRVAARTELNIVVATGVYTYHELPFQFGFRGPGTLCGGPELLDRLFIRDVEEGIAGTGVRAAVLKCATDAPGLTPDVERSLRAVASAHRATGAPISTHTLAANRSGLDQQRVLASEGVDLGAVVVGHSGDTTDLEYLQRLVAAGSYVGLDRFGFDLVLGHEDRVTTLVALCAEGLHERIVLSQDYSSYNAWLDAGYVAEHAPRWSFLHLMRDVLPDLRERGVREDQLDAMLVANPRRILGGGAR